MGSNEDIMHEFVKKELIRAYPSTDGWSVSPIGGKGKDQGFVARKRFKGKTISVNILVSFDKKVTKNLVDKLNSLRKNPDIASVLVVPQGAEVGMVPDDVKIRYMRSFAFEGKDLIWIRKRLQSPATATMTPAAA
jgi:hypothetical protein